MIPPKEWEHDPNKQENNGMTVAMRLTLNGIIPPKQWYHDPLLKNKNNNWTTAMYIAHYCKQIPE